MGPELNPVTGTEFITTVFMELEHKFCIHEINHWKTVLPITCIRICIHLIISNYKCIIFHHHRYFLIHNIIFIQAENFLYIFFVCARGNDREFPPDCDVTDSRVQSDHVTIVVSGYETPHPGLGRHIEFLGDWPRKVDSRDGVTIFFILFCWQPSLHILCWNMGGEVTHQGNCLVDERSCSALETSRDLF